MRVVRSETGGSGWIKCRPKSFPPSQSIVPLNGEYSGGPDGGSPIFTLAVAELEIWVGVLIIVVRAPVLPCGTKISYQDFNEAKNVFTGAGGS